MHCWLLNQKWKIDSVNRLVKHNMFLYQMLIKTAWVLLINEITCDPVHKQSILCVSPIHHAMQYRCWMSQEIFLVFTLLCSLVEFVTKCNNFAEIWIYSARKWNFEVRVQGCERQPLNNIPWLNTFCVLWKWIITYRIQDISPEPKIFSLSFPLPL